ncbi:AAA family ATPase [Falsirhodobacter xinxiangensis]|uniref:AAA family ATPase n=1 Tax=Falsirhodobacter xinxiangensis TaxID=2530049 RepID=UPI0010AAC714|nr:AAA family ATPase [Rhodobacter xinxiangensis]
MKIRAIELTNIRRFAGQSARIEVGDGVTVLSEPNEFGKSTFFDALHALFFERHRGTRAPVKALQPHSGGAPEVAVELDLPEGQFRVEKRWLSRATARVHQNGRLIAQDDEAEAWIDRILGLAGPSGLLWVRQGVLGMEPEGGTAADKQDRERALTARRDLLSSVAGEIEMMTGGRRLDAVMARVGEALAKLATSTGRAKTGGDWARAEGEAEALRGREAELAAKAARLSGELSRRAGVQRQLRDLDDPEADRRRTEALTDAEAADTAARAHAEKLAEAQRALKLASVTEENSRSGIERLEQLSERLARAEADLTAAEGNAAKADARADNATSADRETAAVLGAAQDAARALQTRLAAAQRQQLAAAARNRAEILARALARAESLRTTLEGQRAARSLLTVTPKALAEAEQAREAHDRLLALRDAQSVSVHLRYDGKVRVHEAGRDLPEGQHRLTSARDFVLPGIGTMRVDPGSGAGGDEGAVAKAADVLAAKLAACGAETLADARGRLADAQALDAGIRGTEALIAEIAPDGLETLRRDLAKAQADAGADQGSVEDPAAMEAALADAMATETAAKHRATETHAAFLAATEARAGTRAALAAATRTAEAARMDAGDLSALASRLHDLRAEHVTHLARRSEAAAHADTLAGAAPDMDMVTASLSRARSVVQQAAKMRETLQNELSTLNGSINAQAEEGVEEELDEVRGRLATAAARAGRYAAEVQALTRLRDTLDASRREARDAYFGPVLRELEPLLSVLHPGAALAIDDQTLLPKALTRGGQEESLDILSGGTREQVAVLTRLAFARLFARSGTSVPVILDDALVHSDDDRIEAMFTALHRVAKDQQIIVLTCRQRAFAALGGDRVRAVITAV